MRLDLLSYTFTCYLWIYHRLWTHQKGSRQSGPRQGKRNISEHFRCTTNPFYKHYHYSYWARKNVGFTSMKIIRCLVGAAWHVHRGRTNPMLSWLGILSFDLIHPISFHCEQNTISKDSVKNKLYALVYKIMSNTLWQKNIDTLLPNIMSLKCL